MADLNLPHKMDNEKSVYLDREEHVHRGEVGAKRVVLYNYDSETDTLIPVNSQTTARYDYAANPIYIGEAPLGTSEATEAWTVTRYDLSSSTDATGKVASGIAWDNRASGTYL